jgi:hypothetical protein
MRRRARRSTQPLGIMKRITLALLLACVSAVVKAMDFHPGAYATLKLGHLSQKDLTATLKGHVVVTGAIEAVWEAGEDGVPMQRRYSLLLDAEAAERMPTLDDYRVEAIYIQNGADALRLAVGADAAKAFEERKILRISANATFRLTQVGMGIACSQLHVGARIVSITGVAQLAMLNTPAPMSVC